LISRFLAYQCQLSNTIDQLSETASGYHYAPIPPTGLLYQQIGSVNPIVSEFKLVTFIDISALEISHDEIVNLHRHLKSFCDQYIWEHPNTSIRSNCEWMKTSTASIFHQIEQVKGEILGSLGSDYQMTRTKRGLVNAVGRIAKVLFGVCSDEDADFLYTKVSELSQSKARTLNILDAQTRIVKTTISDLNTTFTIILKERKKIEDVLKQLNEKLGKSLAFITELETREMLIEQTTVISLLLTQQAFGVQKLLHIVNSAIHGQIHPNLMTHQQYIEQLREVKLNLPSGLNLPFSLDTFTVTKLIQISQVSVLFSVNTLIFIQKIPLVESSKYNLYKVIPFPVVQQSKIYSLIVNTVTYLAISENKQNYITFSEIEYANCKIVGNNYYCENTQPKYSTGSRLCELQLLIGQNLNNSICNIQYIKLVNSVFVKLKDENVWVYVASKEPVSISCNSKGPIDFILDGTGELFLNKQCRLFTKDYLLIPSQTFVNNITRKLYNPLINTYNSLNKKLTKHEEDLLNQYNFSEPQNINSLTDLIQQSKALSNIENEINELKKNENPTGQNYYLMLVVVLTAILLTVMIIFYCFCRFNSKTPIMYHPEEVIAETPI